MAPNDLSLHSRGLLLLFCLAMLAGCDRSSDTTSAEDIQTTQGSAPTAEVVSNASVRLEMLPLDAVQLEDGRYENPQENLSAQVAAYARGVFADDGAPRAAALISSAPGGSGIFYELVVFESTGKGQARQVAAATVGDRIGLDSMKVRNNSLEISYTGHGPDDPMCCPTQEMFRAYRLSGTQLREISRQ